MMTNEELSEDSVSEPWRHATMYAFNVEEDDAYGVRAKRCSARANCH